MDSSVIAVGIIETFAGNGKSRSTGDGKPATKAGMPLPVGVAIDPQNQSLYYTESGSDRVRRIELATGIISHVAGIGETCYSGDGGAAAQAGGFPPLGVGLCLKGGFYIFGFRGKPIPPGGKKNGDHRATPRGRGVLLSPRGPPPPGHN